MATVLFTPYVDQENVTSHGVSTKGRGRLDSATGKPGLRPFHLDTPRKALGDRDVNKDLSGATPTPGGKGYNSFTNCFVPPQSTTKSTFKTPAPGIVRTAPVMRLPLTSESGNIQSRLKKHHKQRNESAKITTSKPPQLSQNPSADSYDEIEFMDVRKHAEIDDFEDILPKKDRVSSYLDRLITWRPPCLFGVFPESDDDTDLDDEERREQEFNVMMDDMERVANQLHAKQDAEDDAHPIIALEEVSIADVSLPSLDDSVDLTSSLTTSASLQFMNN